MNEDAFLFWIILFGGIIILWALAVFASTLLSQLIFGDDRLGEWVIFFPFKIVDKIRGE